MKESAVLSLRLLADCKRARLTCISSPCSIKYAKQKAIVKHRFKLSCESAQMLPSRCLFPRFLTALSAQRAPTAALSLLQRDSSRSLRHGNFSRERIAVPNMAILRPALLCARNIGPRASHANAHSAPTEGYTQCYCKRDRIS